MNLSDWLSIGETEGWLVGRFCGAHDFPQILPRERQEAADLGIDPLDRCYPCIRLNNESEQ